MIDRAAKHVVHDAKILIVDDPKSIPSGKSRGAIVLFDGQLAKVFGHSNSLRLDGNLRQRFGASEPK